MINFFVNIPLVLLYMIMESSVIAYVVKYMNLPSNLDINFKNIFLVYVIIKFIIIKKPYVQPEKTMTSEEEILEIFKLFFINAIRITLIFFLCAFVIGTYKGN